jgi:hypothetical protein
MAAFEKRLAVDCFSFAAQCPSLGDKASDLGRTCYKLNIIVGYYSFMGRHDGR